MNLRQLARGKLCMVRLPGCTGGGEADGTVVLAHYRMSGYCGMGMKPPDELGAWCCASCHDHVDRRVRTLEADFVRLAHAEGVLRTMIARIEESRK